MFQTSTAQVCFQVSSKTKVLMTGTDFPFPSLLLHSHQSTAKESWSPELSPPVHYSWQQDSSSGEKDKTAKQQGKERDKEEREKKHHYFPVQNLELNSCLLKL